MEKVYIKTKKGKIFECYVSEQMNKPIYYPVDSKTNGYIDYYDVERFLKIDSMYREVKQLQQENEQLKADYGNIAQVERDILLQQKEELIKHCENEIFSQKESIELLSNKKYADIHIGAINAYKNILSKLKGE